MNQTHLQPHDQNGIALCRVTYRMTDKMGVVYHANYLEMFEMGRVEMLRSSGVSYRQMEEEGFLLPVVRAECDYVVSAKYDDLLEVRTKIVTLTRAKIHFGYEIRRRGDNAEIARGVTHHVFLSPEGKLRRLAPFWMEKLQSLAGGEVKVPV
jgi:acyl-CoA thioester hydrolase